MQTPHPERTHRYKDAQTQDDHNTPLRQWCEALALVFALWLSALALASVVRFTALVTSQGTEGSKVIVTIQCSIGLNKASFKFYQVSTTCAAVHLCSTAVDVYLTHSLKQAAARLQ